MATHASQESPRKRPVLPSDIFNRSTNARKLAYSTQSTELEQSIYTENGEIFHLTHSISELRQSRIITQNARRQYPTPAIMPAKRQSEGPTTFASLEAQDLPMVREYSAGGLIFDHRGCVAIIARHSRSGHWEWCLPKGHIEKGETPRLTAVREVFEETGILGEVVEPIATIDYWFTGTTQRIHKLVHHFSLRRLSGEITVENDPDHEAEDAKWVPFEELESTLSYPNERKIAWIYARKLSR